MSYVMTNLPILVRALGEKLKEVNYSGDLMVEFYLDQDLISTLILSEALIILAEGTFLNSDGELIMPNGIRVRDATLKEKYGF